MQFGKMCSNLTEVFIYIPPFLCLQAMQTTMIRSFIWARSSEHSLLANVTHKLAYYMYADSVSLFPVYLKGLFQCFDLAPLTLVYGFLRPIFLKPCLTWPRHEIPCLRGFENNIGENQPAHPRSLISAFVIRFLESIICRIATGEISIF